MKFKKLETTAAIAAALLSVSPAVITPVVNASNNIDTATTQVKKTVGFSWGTVVAPTAKRTTPIFTGLKSGHVQMTDKTLKDNTKIKVYYGVKLGTTTWYNIGDENYVSAKNILVNQFVPMKNGMGKQIKTTNDEAHFTHYGILTVKSASKKSVALYDANGKRTRQRVRVGSNWKFWAIKRINGQVMLRIGSQKQWIPLVYTNLLGENKKQSERNIIKGLSRGSRYIARKRAARHAIKLTKKNRAVMNGVPQIHYNTNGYREVNDSNSIQTNQTAINNSNNAADLNSANNTNTQSSADDNSSDTNISNNSNDNTIVNNTNTDTNDSNNKQSQAGQTTNTGNNNGQNGQTAGNTQGNTGNQTTPVQPTTPADHNNSGNAGQSSDQGQLATDNKGSQSGNQDQTSTPQNPTTPVQPSGQQPTQPTKPAQPTTPVNPNHGNAGSQAGTSTDHNNSGSQQGSQTTPSTDHNNGNTGSQTGNNSGNTGKTDVQPTTPTKPTTPQQPTTPTKPSTGDNTGNQSGQQSGNTGSQSGQTTSSSQDQHGSQGGQQSGSETTPVTPSHNTDNTGNQGSTTPAQPTKPQQPTQPTQPSKDDNKGNTDKPVQPTIPSKDQGKTDMPVTGDKDDNKGKGDNTPAKPTTPDKPVQPTKPQQPTQPSKDDNKGTDKPVQPTTPSKDQDKTDKPATGNKDDNKDKGDDTPAKQTTPDKPAQPTKPQQPTQPSKDDNKGNTDKPVQPTTPSKDQGKTDKPVTGDKDDNKGKGNNTPAKPTTPDKPVQPTKPQQPTQPTEPVVQNSTLTVSYVDNTTEKAVGSQNFTGKVGSTERINLTLPQGYKLIDGEIVPTEYTFKNTNKPMTVKVESAKKDNKPATPKKKTTLTINFKDIDTDTIVDNQVFAGTEGSNINISGLHIPDKYQVADHQQLPTQYTFTDKNEVKDILIKKIPDKKVVLTINYINNADNSLVRSDEFPGIAGHSVHFIGLEVPTGYKLAEGQSLPENYVMPQKDTALDIRVDKIIYTRHLTVVINDDAGNTVSTKTYTGDQGTTATLNTEIPEEHPDYYEWVGKTIPATYKFGNHDDTQVYEIKLRTTNHTINLVDPDGNVVATKTVSGKIGTSQHITDLMPSGYVLDQNQILPTDVAMMPTNTTDTISVYKPVHYTITVVDADGNTVSTKTYTGKQETIANIDNSIHEKDPDNYEFVGNNIPATITFGKNDVTKIYHIDLKKTNDTINLVDPDGNVIATKKLTGKIGSTQNVDNLLPDGYVLDAGQSIPASVQFSNKDAVQNISVYKPVHYTITVLDADGNTVSTKTYTGKQETVANIDNSIHETDPDNYEFVGNNIPATITFGKNDITKIYHIDLKKTNDTINLVDPDGNVIVTKKLTGKIGSTQNIDNLLPDGYVLDAGQSIPTSVQFSNKDAVQNIAVYKPVHYTITVQDDQGNVLSTQTITGKQGTKHAIKAVSLDNTNLDDKNIADYTTDKGNLPTEITLGKTDDNITYTLSVKQAQVVLNFQENGTTIATKTVNGKLGSTIQLKPILPDGYTFPITGSYYTSYTFNQLNGILNVPVAKRQALGTLANISVDQYYQLHGTFTGYGSVFLKDLTKDSSPENIGFNMDSSSVTDFANNSSYNLKKYAGDKVLIYVTDIMDFNGTDTSNPGSVTIDLPAPKIPAMIIDHEFTHKDNVDNNPNDYTLTLTLSGDVKDSNFSLKDANGSEYMIEPKVDGSKVRFEVNENEYKAGNYITVGVKTYIDPVDSVDHSFKIDLPEFQDFENTIQDVPYNANQCYHMAWIGASGEDPKVTEQYMTGINKACYNDLMKYHYHTENLADTKEVVDPRNLTADQQTEINDFAIRLINQARQLVKNNGATPILNDNGTVGVSIVPNQLTSASVTPRIQKLANDIATEYQNNNESIASPNSEPYTDPKTGNTTPTNGHYVAGIVRACRANGLDFDNNYVESEGGGYVYTVSSYKGHITMDNLKEQVYQDITNMIYAGGIGHVSSSQGEYGKGDGAEYGHAQAIIGVGEGYMSTHSNTEFALSFSTVPDELVGENVVALITTHYIIVGDNNKKSTDSTWED